MRAAAEYSVRFEWQQRTPGTADGFGQRPDTFPAQGYLWGKLDDLTGGRETTKESEHQTQTATIRLRGWPAVGPRDRLKDMRFGDVWTVESVTRGDNEWVCEVTRPKWTAGGGTAQ